MSFIRAPEIVAEELMRRPGLKDQSPLVERAQKRADALGLDLTAVLQKDAERLAEFPTAECLTPLEVAAYSAGEGFADPFRAQHVANCEFCARILEVAQPTPQQVERFLDELGSFAARASLNSDAQRARAISTHSRALPAT
jgi:hypothetical protein